VDLTEAARVLGVAASAPRSDVERAYRRRAAETHPDRFAGESAERVAAASTEFLLVGEAFAVLTAPRVTSAYVPTVVPFARGFLYAWLAVLAVGIALSFSGGPSPFGAVENLVRTALVAVGLVGYALTGRRPYSVLALVALIATALFTVTHASFGALLALLVVEPAAIALLIAGRRRERLRTAR